MKSSPLLLTALLILAQSWSGLAHAGDQAADKAAAPASSKPSDAPPKPDKLEQGDPAVTVRKPQGTKMTEVRRADQSRETRVDTGSTRYTVRQNKPAGSSQPGDTQSSPNRGAEFNVLQFDLGTRKQKPAAADKAASDDAKK